MRYLIDSNIWIYAAADQPRVIRFLDSAAHAEWIGYSAISRLELFGFPDLKPEDEGKLQKLLGFCAEVTVSSDVIDRAIALRKEKTIKAPDAIVAATALVANATLVTRNTDDFKTIKGLSILNPFDSTDSRC
ncbi:MAG: type II toxin-antitoxin system VapC family toxin [Pirellulaceae bacterium]